MRLSLFLLLLICSFHFVSAQDYSRIALNVGSSKIYGDVDSWRGNAQGLEVMKHSKYFGAGLWIHQTENFGLDRCYSLGINPSTGEEYLNYHNYKSEAILFGLQASIGQMNYRDSSWKGKIIYSLDLAAGVGIFNASSDELDENGQLYDYTQLDINNNHTLCNADTEYEIYEEIFDFTDYKYETEYLKDEVLFTLKPQANIGLAYKKFAMFYSFSALITQNDLLDARRWTDSGTSTDDFDLLVMHSYGVQITLF